MEPADLVIRRFGSLRKLAAALGHNSHTTVQGWKASGRIPAQQQVAVLDAAVRLGIALTSDELVRGGAGGRETQGNSPGETPPECTNNTSIPVPDASENSDVLATRPIVAMGEGFAG